MISIILPTFNNQDTISKTILSVKNQKFKFWELIIIDDGSTDNTLRIINNFKKNDSRIKVIHAQHGGAAKARNIGLDAAIGGYIAFIDADDRFDDLFLQSGIEKLKEENADIAIFDFIRIKKNKKYIENVDTNLFECYSACWNKIYKKHLWENIRFPENLVIEDMETVIPVVGRAQKIVKVANSYYHYVNRSNSITNTPSLRSEYQIGIVIKILHDNFSKFNVRYNVKEYSKFINTFLYWHLISVISSRCGREEKIKISKFINKYFVKYKHQLLFQGSYKSMIKKRIIILLIKAHIFSNYS